MAAHPKEADMRRKAREPKNSPDIEFVLPFSSENSLFRILGKVTGNAHRESLAQCLLDVSLIAP